MNVRTISHSLGRMQDSQGLTKMKCNISITRFVSTLVDHYAKFDPLTESYELPIHTIPDFERYELSALLMLSNTSYANEATGSDNPDYERKMLPALINYMSNVTDKDEEIEFKRIWKDGIAKYFTPMMEELIESELSWRVRS